MTGPSDGTDTNTGKTKAFLHGDKWAINGEKMWSTNGGFADVFTVFAKIDDDDVLSAFIVKKGVDGLTLNPEEKKMGIKNFFKRFIQEEEGATAVEYAVMIVLIIVVCLATVAFLGKEVEKGFNKVATTLSNNN